MDIQDEQALAAALKLTDEVFALQKVMRDNDPSSGAYRDALAEERWINK